MGDSAERASASSCSSEGGADASAAAAAGAGAAAAAGAAGEGELSKRKQKRLARMGGPEGVKEHWELKKRQYKERVKARKQQMKAERDAAWAALPEEERAAKRRAIREHFEREKREKEELQQRVEERTQRRGELPQCVIDLEFDSTMDDKQARSTAQQVALSHSHLRRQGLPMWLRLVGAVQGGRLRKLLEDKPGWSSWSLSVSEQTLGGGALADVPGGVVYLTGDSPHLLSDVKPGVAYVIGGFVDRNTKKGLTLAKAEGLGLQHARLPIEENCDVRSLSICKTLTVNHVVEILAHFVQGRDWAAAFAAVLPLRRAADEVKQAAKDTFRTAACSLAARAAGTAGPAPAGTATAAPSAAAGPAPAAAPAPSAGAAGDAGAPPAAAG
eukprot:TRINITY_DN3991_c0_g3_i1.p1 TRINITY_DN3991_c0_g3~~TRINITY_DN3991_c0_g3_i1.p1  ORF type:complete len:416 (+),score=155.82 TRINITY_DN3991_c0_g3_i1:91-1248(+)